MNTVCLSRAKELKKAGFSEEPYFYWEEEWGPNPHTLKQTPKPLGKFYLTHIPYPQLYNETGGYKTVIYAAPTADEILDLLPKQIVIGETIYYITINPGLPEGTWQVDYRDLNDGQITAAVDGCLACAGAEIWIYLKKNNLL